MFSYKLLKVALIHILPEPEPAGKAELQKWYIGSEESKKRMKQIQENEVRQWEVMTKY